MPNISIVVPEVQQSVLRPVVLDIVRQVEDITKISKDSVILFPGELNRTYQPGSALKEDNLDRTKFMDDDIVQIEVDEDFYKEAVMTTAVARDEQLPIFFDDALGIFVKPVYATTTVKINYKFRSKSKTTIQRWRNDIRMRTSAMREFNMHQITYSYLIPGEFINILFEIHKLREAVEPYGEDFNTYLKNYASTRVTELTNLSGEKREISVAETQMRIIGFFDFEGFPEKPEHDEETDTWIGTFSYNFTYEKPIACNMRYPVMVHNQVLSNKFRPETKDAYNLDNHLQSFSLSFNALNYFEAQLQIDKYVNINANITIPEFDEFIPQDIIRSTVPVFTALCSLALPDKRVLINLRDLGDIALDKDILNFIEKSEYPFMGKTYQSILQVNIYKSTICTNQEMVSVKPNLDICATEDLNPRVNHRVRLSIVTDLTLLSKEALDRLKNYPLALVKIIQAINEGLRNNPGFAGLGAKSYVNKDDIFNYILKPNPAGVKINPNMACVVIKKAKRNDTHILALIERIIKDTISFLDTITINKFVNLKPIVDNFLLLTKGIYTSVADNNYTDLILKMIDLRGKVEEINSLIVNDREKDLLFRGLMKILNDIIAVINELQLINDGTYSTSLDCANNIGTRTVMSTSVIARDGVRGARIEDYKN